MSYLRINVEKGNKDFVEQLLNKLGYEVAEEAPVRKRREPKTRVSPTFLFSKWKDLDIEPATFRKKVWGRGR